MQHYKFDARNYQSPINNTSRVMAFINNVYDIKKGATKITFWNCGNKVHYAKDYPDKNTDNDTDTD